MQAQSQPSNPPFRCHGTLGYFARYPQIRTAQAVEVVLGWCDDWALGVGGDGRRCAAQGGDEGCPLSNPTPPASRRCKPWPPDQGWGMAPVWDGGGLGTRALARAFGKGRIGSRTAATAHSTNRAHGMEYHRETFVHEMLHSREDGTFMYVTFQREEAKADDREAVAWTGASGNLRPFWPSILTIALPKNRSSMRDKRPRQGGPCEKQKPRCSAVGVSCCRLRETGTSLRSRKWTWDSIV